MKELVAVGEWVLNHSRAIYLILYFISWLIKQLRERRKAKLPVKREVDTEIYEEKITDKEYIRKFKKINVKEY